MRAVNKETSEVVLVVGFLGQDTGKGFACVYIAQDGSFKAIENWKLIYTGDMHEGKLESDTTRPSGAV